MELQLFLDRVGRCLARDGSLVLYKCPLHKTTRVVVPLCGGCHFISWGANQTPGQLCQKMVNHGREKVTPSGGNFLPLPVHYFS